MNDFTTTTIDDRTGDMGTALRWGLFGGLTIHGVVIGMLILLT